MNSKDIITTAITPLLKYAQLKGRASRTEYWLFHLLYCVLLLGFSILSHMADSVGASSLSMVFAIMTLIWTLGTIIPFLALLVRRLHDTGRSGWWSLTVLLPVIGLILWFVIGVIKPTPQTQEADS